MRFLDWLLVRWAPFDPADAANPSLRNTTPAVAATKAERHRMSLLAQYLAGAISSYQCRIFFNDYVRDSLPLRMELRMRAQHEIDILSLTLHSHGVPADEDVEAVLISLLKAAQRGTITPSEARGRFEYLAARLEGEAQHRWLQNFSSVERKVRS
jgi:hypothetical protein